MTDRVPRSRRVFFALWPAPATARAIARVADADADPVHEDDLHLTIAFLGGLTESEFEALPMLATGMRIEPFVLRLDHVGYWAGVRARVLVPSTVPAPLLALRAELLRRLAGAGLAVGRPAEAEFHPHVTLARRATAPVALGPLPGIEWQVTGITLAATEPVTDGRHYRRVATLGFTPLDQ